MRVLVVGDTEVAVQVALGLRRIGAEVTVVDADGRRAGGLGAAAPPVVVGDPLVPSVLERAGVLRADAVACCAATDEENLVVSLLAKRRFGVRRVIASVNEPANQSLFDDRWGVDQMVSPAAALITLISRAESGAGHAPDGG
ncbi:MAG: NAD-binding protein [Actinomycetota bacterium]|nr:NAD-binding protein [Actinomycetota bacterium]